MEGGFLGENPFTKMREAAAVRQVAAERRASSRGSKLRIEEGVQKLTSKYSIQTLDPFMQ